MQILLATDIFGVTAWTEKLQQTWVDCGHDVEILSPYEQIYSFDCEDRAYNKFTELGGFERYCAKIVAVIEASLTRPTVYLGFSAGGAALWRVLAQYKVSEFSHLVAFYPGQIRHHLNLTPSLTTSIIFPEKEQHFDLSAIIEYLVTKPKLNIIQNSLQHGYANPSSKHYEQRASDELFELLTDIEHCASETSLLDRIIHCCGEYKKIE